MSEPTARDHATATDVRSRCWDTQTDPCNCVARALAAERARVLDPFIKLAQEAAVWLMGDPDDGQDVPTPLGAEQLLREVFRIGQQRNNEANNLRAVLDLTPEEAGRAWRMVRDHEYTDSTSGLAFLAALKARALGDT